MLLKLKKIKKIKNRLYLLQAAIPRIIIFTIGIIIKIAHQPGLPITSKVFHNHIMKKTVKAKPKIPPMNGINAPINNNIGHQCIFAVLLAIKAGPTAGIQAMPGLGYFAFLAIAINANEL